ncbi:MAG: hypothetical protein GX024_06090 [Clostridiales bacterium]|nr:hypothetical protein [Clostridiales bacterium]
MAKGYYHRSFVILQSRDGRFNIASGKPAAGHCKMEVRNNRCKMSFHVQDLKPRQANEGRYDIFLVSANNYLPCLKIASIFIDERGRGETTLELDINHVAGTGYSLDQFHGLALVCNDPDDIKLPLVGYANKRVTLDWAGRIKKDLAKYYGREIKSRVRVSDVEQTDSRSSVDKKETGLSAEEVDFPEHKEEQAIEDTAVQQPKDAKQEPVEDAELEEQKTEPDIMQDTGRLEQEREKEEIGQDEVPELEKVLLAEEQKQRQLEESMQEKDQPQAKMQQEQNVIENSYYQKDEREEAKVKQQKAASKDTYWERVKDYYTKLFENNRKVYPFDIGSDGAEWVEVPQTSGYDLQGYTSPAYYGIYDHGYPYYDHYIVGIIKEKDDVRYIVYGVPGTYAAMPPVYMQGFSAWKPVRNSYRIGYWLLYIDALTGEITYPF